MPLLDAITRAPLWKEQIDYIHGTGHGVGYFLNVHEGPQVLSYLSPVLEKTKAKEGIVMNLFCISLSYWYNACNICCAVFILSTRINK
ncbi:M24 family metallopeptidase [Campylobacter jejuni]|uniref:M24 family metallopeptidase n=1 Tax=Campylobacter jejuni TaxID=197 RepID=UPI003F514345